MNDTTNIPWGERFLSALEKIIDPAKLQKGRFYAKNDRIANFSIKGGTVTAEIAGTVKPQMGVYREPVYNTSLNIKQIKDADWQKAIDHIASKASLVTRIILEKLPDNLDSVFQEIGLSLMPDDVEDITSDCTCSDWDKPCKHITGLLHLLANQINQKPSTILELRGSSLGELNTQLSIIPLGRILSSYFKVRESVLPIDKTYFTAPKLTNMTEDVTLDTIWEGDESLPTDFRALEPAPTSALKIRTMGDNPSFWKEDNSFIETMNEIYIRVKKSNQTVLGIEDYVPD
jgi:uncharacterized Zn finger protein